VLPGRKTSRPDLTSTTRYRPMIPTVPVNSHLDWPPSDRDFLCPTASLRMQRARSRPGADLSLPSGGRGAAGGR
jgi:hypothetical protein